LSQRQLSARRKQSAAARQQRHVGQGRFSPTIAELLAGGATSLPALAAGLNGKGIETARGRGEWTATQVMRVLDRLET
jgi:hypothetical protein